MSTMILEIDGQPLDIFTAKRSQTSIEQASGIFNFRATSNVINNFPVKRLASCRVLIENEPVLTGFVDSIRISYNSENHIIDIKGRDKTSILIDSSVLGDLSFNTPISLQQIVEKVISRLGADIDIVNNVPGLSTFKNQVVAEISESAFGFIERHCRKKQILLTTNGNGDVVLTRASKTTIRTKLLNQKGNFENNVLSSIAVYDDSERYFSYSAKGQALGGDDIPNANQTDKTGGPVFDTFVRSFNPKLDARRLILQMEEETDIESARDRAIWEANIRRARAITYSCIVQGFFHKDGLWKINTLVNVIDDYANIKSDMLVKSVEYKENEDGTFTNLELVSPDAYTLQASREKKDALINEIGEDFVL